MKWPFGKKDTSYLEYKRTLATAEAAGEAQHPPQPIDPATDYVETYGKIAHLTKPEKALAWLEEHKEFQALIAALEPVNRSTYLTPRQAEVQKLKFKRLFLRMRLEMNPNIYELGASNVLKGFDILADNQVNEAIEGKKLIALTQVSKRIEIETEKKKGLFR